MMPRIACLLTALLLCACAAKPVKRPPPPPPVVECKEVVPVVTVDPASLVLGELLGYQAGVRLQTQAELQRALQALAAQPAQPVSNQLLLRRAMLLAALHGPGDMGRAQQLADSVAQSTSEEPGIKPLAQLLAAGYADARRQEETIERLNGQLREGQRRNEQLNEKLEALKNIERTLSVRPAPPAVK